MYLAVSFLERKKINHSRLREVGRGQVASGLVANLLLVGCVTLASLFCLSEFS